MASLCESRLFNRTFAFEELSKNKNTPGKKIKFTRAFQFLQLLLIQRVYRLDLITCSAVRRSLKYQQRQQAQEQQHQNYQVFLGGSCNPTTWRHDQAIPYFQSRSVSYYNPQVSDWTPDLVEIEHRAKELAPLLFFVIDHDTRALASIIEVCYLAARGRSIIVVMSPMHDKNFTKFIQQKTVNNVKDDEGDYENACEARETLRQLLRSINVPIFESVRLALECAAFILESTKRTVANSSTINEENDSDRDKVSPLPDSSAESRDLRASSVVVIRSLSNKTTFDSPDEFYRQMRQSDMTPPSPVVAQSRYNATVLTSIEHQFRAMPTSPKAQLSFSTTESDDDGYSSLSSSDRAISVSNCSISSEFTECSPDQLREDNPMRTQATESASMVNSLISKCYSYLPFVTAPPSPSDSPVSQSLFVLLTVPFRFLTNTIFSTPLSSPPALPETPTVESNVFDTTASVSATSSSVSTKFDLYIASGKNDECWLDTVASPILDENNIKFTKRQTHQDNDPLDAVHDVEVRQHSRLLYYLINGEERLSHLATELAYLIGERKHKIIVFLQLNIDEHVDAMLSPCDRRDTQRSRKYLEDLARKENILLSYSREESWTHVLDFFRNRNE